MFSRLCGLWVVTWHVALEARATSFWDVAGAHPGAPELILISFGIYCNEYVKCIIEDAGIPRAFSSYFFHLLPTLLRLSGTCF